MSGRKTTKKPQANAAQNKRTAAEKPKPSTPKAGHSAPQKPAGTAQNDSQKHGIIQRLIFALKFHIFYPWSERSEFRYNTDTLHPQYVFRYEDRNYTSVGLTHEPETFNRKNMPLKNNPKKGDTRPAYIRNGIVHGSYKAYGNKRTLKNMIFSPVDKANVKSKIRNYKNRQRKTKK